MPQQVRAEDLRGERLDDATFAPMKGKVWRYFFALVFFVPAISVGWLVFESELRVRFCDFRNRAPIETEMQAVLLAREDWICINPSLGVGSEALWLEHFVARLNGSEWEVRQTFPEDAEIVDGGLVFYLSRENGGLLAFR